MGVPVPGETALVAAALYAGKTLVYAAHRAHACLNRHPSYCFARSGLYADTRQISK
jgi:hypothetical protein